MGTFWCWHYPTINKIFSYIQEMFKVIYEAFNRSSPAKKFFQIKNPKAIKKETLSN